MRKILLVATFIVSRGLLFAQSEHSFPFESDTPTKHQILVQSLLDKQQSSIGTAQKPTGIHYRVIEQTVGFEGEPVHESIMFKYSGSRGSRFNYNNQAFCYIGGDEPIYNDHFDSNYFPFNLNVVESQSMDVLADSVIHHFTYNNNVKPFSYAQYRSDNKTNFYQNWWVTNTGYEMRMTYHQFNPNGYLTQLTNIYKHSQVPSFDTVNIVKYFYDINQEKLLKDTSYNWYPSGLFPKEAKEYHYNTQNLLDSIWIFKRVGFSSLFSLDMTSAISYNGSGLIEKIRSVQYAEDGTMMEQTTDSVGYSGMLPFYTYFQEEIISDDAVFSKRLIKYIGSNNLPDSAKWFIGAGSSTVTYIYEYDINDNPISTVTTNLGTPYGLRYRFYYETYDDGNNVGIKETRANNNFNLYPNPFNNKINIDWKNAATKAKISLINIIGQTVLTLNKSLSNGNNVIDLPVSVLGDYILMIQDEKGNIYNQKLTKK
jgi:hypothetical protein